MKSADACVRCEHSERVSGMYVCPACRNKVLGNTEAELAVSVILLEREPYDPDPTGEIGSPPAYAAVLDSLTRKPCHYISYYTRIASWRRR